MNDIKKLGEADVVMKLLIDFPMWVSLEDPDHPEYPRQQTLIGDFVNRPLTGRWIAMTAREIENTYTKGLQNMSILDKVEPNELSEELVAAKEIIAKLVQSENKEFKKFAETSPERSNQAMLNWLREHGYMPYPMHSPTDKSYQLRPSTPESRRAGFEAFQKSGSYEDFERSMPTDADLAAFIKDHGFHYGFTPEEIKEMDRRSRVIYAPPQSEVPPDTCFASSGKSETLGEATKLAPQGITGGCAKCAYKHLTAAYAAASSHPSVLPAFPAEQDVYRARARIALGEALTGYPGNIHLAAGCLAMAEQFAESGEDCMHYRKVRLSLLPGDPFALRNALLELKQCAPAAYVYAHVSEALRELPDLADHIGIPRTTDTTYPAALKRAIMWLVDLYELAPDGPAQTEEGEKQ